MQLKMESVVDVSWHCLDALHGFVVAVGSCWGIAERAGCIVCHLIIVVIGCALLIAYAASWHAKILSPVWGRWGDVFEWLSVIAVIPLLLWVLDLYSWAYGLAG